MDYSDVLQHSVFPSSFRNSLSRYASLVDPNRHRFTSIDPALLQHRQPRYLNTVNKDLQHKRNVNLNKKSMSTSPRRNLPDIRYSLSPPPPMSSHVRDQDKYGLRYGSAGDVTSLSREDTNIHIGQENCNNNILILEVEGSDSEVSSEEEGKAQDKDSTIPNSSSAQSEEKIVLTLGSSLSPQKASVSDYHSSREADLELGCDLSLVCRPKKITCSGQIREKEFIGTSSYNTENQILNAQILSTLVEDSDQGSRRQKRTDHGSLRPRSPSPVRNNDNFDERDLDHYIHSLLTESPDHSQSLSHTDEILIGASNGRDLDESYVTTILSNGEHKNRNQVPSSGSEKKDYLSQRVNDHRRYTVVTGSEQGLNDYMVDPREDASVRQKTYRIRNEHHDGKHKREGKFKKVWFDKYLIDDKDSQKKLPEKYYRIFTENKDGRTVEKRLGQSPSPPKVGILRRSKEIEELLDTDRETRSSEQDNGEMYISPPTTVTKTSSKESIKITETALESNVGSQSCKKKEEDTEVLNEQSGGISVATPGLIKGPVEKQFVPIQVPEPVSSPESDEEISQMGAVGGGVSVQKKKETKTDEKRSRTRRRSLPQNIRHVGRTPDYDPTAGRAFAAQGDGAPSASIGDVSRQGRSKHSSVSTDMNLVVDPSFGLFDSAAAGYRFPTSDEKTDKGITETKRAKTGGQNDSSSPKGQEIPPLTRKDSIQKALSPTELLRKKQKCVTNKILKSINSATDGSKTVPFAASNFSRDNGREVKNLSVSVRNESETLAVDHETSGIEIHLNKKPSTSISGQPELSEKTERKTGETSFADTKDSRQMHMRSVGGSAISYELKGVSQEGWVDLSHEFEMLRPTPHKLKKKERIEALEAEKMKRKQYKSVDLRDGTKSASIRVLKTGLSSATPLLPAPAIPARLQQSDITRSEMQDMYDKQDIQREALSELETSQLDFTVTEFSTQTGEKVDDQKNAEILPFSQTDKTEHNIKEGTEQQYILNDQVPSCLEKETKEEKKSHNFRFIKFKTLDKDSIKLKTDEECVVDTDTARQYHEMECKDKSGIPVKKKDRDSSGTKCSKSIQESVAEQTDSPESIVLSHIPGSNEKRRRSVDVALAKMRAYRFDMKDGEVEEEKQEKEDSAGTSERNGRRKSGHVPVSKKMLDFDSIAASTPKYVVNIADGYMSKDKEVKKDSTGEPNAVVPDVSTPEDETDIDKVFTSNHKNVEKYSTDKSEVAEVTDKSKPDDERIFDKAFASEDKTVGKDTTDKLENDVFADKFTTKDEQDTDEINSPKSVSVQECTDKITAQRDSEQDDDSLEDLESSFIPDENKRRHSIDVATLKSFFEDDPLVEEDSISFVKSKVENTRGSQDNAGKLVPSPSTSPKGKGKRRKSFDIGMLKTVIKHKLKYGKNGGQNKSASAKEKPVSAVKDSKLKVQEESGLWYFEGEADEDESVIDRFLEDIEEPEEGFEIDVSFLKEEPDHCPWTDTIDIQEGMKICDTESSVSKFLNKTQVLHSIHGNKPEEKGIFSCPVCECEKISDQSFLQSVDYNQGQKVSDLISLFSCGDKHQELKCQDKENATNDSEVIIAQDKSPEEKKIQFVEKILIDEPKEDVLDIDIKKGEKKYEEKKSTGATLSVSLSDVKDDGFCEVKEASGVLCENSDVVLTLPHPDSLQSLIQEEAKEVKIFVKDNGEESVLDIIVHDKEDETDTEDEIVTIDIIPSVLPGRHEERRRSLDVAMKKMQLLVLYNTDDSSAEIHSLTETKEVEKIGEIKETEKIDDKKEMTGGISLDYLQDGKKEKRMIDEEKALSDDDNVRAEFPSPAMLQKSRRDNSISKDAVPKQGILKRSTLVETNSENDTVTGSPEFSDDQVQTLIQNDSKSDGNIPDDWDGTGTLGVFSHKDSVLLAKRKAERREMEAKENVQAKCVRFQDDSEVFWQFDSIEDDFDEEMGTGGKSTQYVYDQEQVNIDFNVGAQSWVSLKTEEKKGVEEKIDTVDVIPLELLWKYEERTNSLDGTVLKIQSLDLDTDKLAQESPTNGKKEQKSHVLENEKDIVGDQNEIKPEINDDLTAEDFADKILELSADDRIKRESEEIGLLQDGSKEAQTAFNLKAEDDREEEVDNTIIPSVLPGKNEERRRSVDVAIMKISLLDLEHEDSSLREKSISAKPVAGEKPSGSKIMNIPVLDVDESYKEKDKANTEERSSMKGQLEVVGHDEPELIWNKEDLEKFLQGLDKVLGTVESSDILIKEPHKEETKALNTGSENKGILEENMDQTVNDHESSLQDLRQSCVVTEEKLDMSQKAIVDKSKEEYEQKDVVASTNDAAVETKVDLTKAETKRKDKTGTNVPTDANSQSISSVKNVLSILQKKQKSLLSDDSEEKIMQLSHHQDDQTSVTSQESMKYVLSDLDSTVPRFIVKESVMADAHTHKKKPERHAPSAVGQDFSPSSDTSSIPIRSAKEKFFKSPETLWFFETCSDRPKDFEIKSSTKPDEKASKAQDTSKEHPDSGGESKLDQKGEPFVAECETKESLDGYMADSDPSSTYPLSNYDDTGKKKGSVSVKKKVDKKCQRKLEAEDSQEEFGKDLSLPNKDIKQKTPCHSDQREESLDGYLTDVDSAMTFESICPTAPVDDKLRMMTSANIVAPSKSGSGSMTSEIVSEMYDHPDVKQTKVSDTDSLPSQYHCKLSVETCDLDPSICAFFDPLIRDVVDEHFPEDCIEQSALPHQKIPSAALSSEETTLVQDSAFLIAKYKEDKTKNVQSATHMVTPKREDPAKASYRKSCTLLQNCSFIAESDEEDKIIDSPSDSVITTEASEPMPVPEKMQHLKLRQVLSFFDQESYEEISTEGQSAITALSDQKQNRDYVQPATFKLMSKTQISSEHPQSSILLQNPSFAEDSDEEETTCVSPITDNAIKICEPATKEDKILQLKAHQVSSLFGGNESSEDIPTCHQDTETIESEHQWNSSVFLQNPSFEVDSDEEEITGEIAQILTLASRAYETRSSVTEQPEDQKDSECKRKSCMLLKNPSFAVDSDEDGVLNDETSFVVDSNKHEMTFEPPLVPALAPCELDSASVLRALAKVSQVFLIPDEVSTEALSTDRQNNVSAVKQADLGHERRSCCLLQNPAFVVDSEEEEEFSDVQQAISGDENQTSVDSIKEVKSCKFLQNSSFAVDSEEEEGFTDVQQVANRDDNWEKANPFKKRKSCKFLQKSSFEVESNGEDKITEILADPECQKVFDKLLQNPIFAVDSEEEGRNNVTICVAAVTSKASDPDTMINNCLQSESGQIFFFLDDTDSSEDISAGLPSGGFQINSVQSVEPVVAEKGLLPGSTLPSSSTWSTTANVGSDGGGRYNDVALDLTEDGLPELPGPSARINGSSECLSSQGRNSKEDSSSVTADEISLISLDDIRDGFSFGISPDIPAAKWSTTAIACTSCYDTSKTQTTGQDGFCSVSQDRLNNAKNEEEQKGQTSSKYVQTTNVSSDLDSECLSGATCLTCLAFPDEACSVQVEIGPFRFTVNQSQVQQSGGQNEPLTLRVSYSPTVGDNKSDEDTGQEGSPERGQRLFGSSQSLDTRRGDVKRTKPAHIGRGASTEARSFMMDREVIESQNRKLQMEISTLQTENKLLKEKFNRSQGKIKELERELHESQEELNTLQENLNSEVSAMSSRTRSEVEQDRDQLQTKILVLTKENETLKAEVNGLEKKLANSNRITDMARHNSEKNRTLEAHVSEIASLKEELGRVKALLEQSERHLKEEEERHSDTSKRVIKLTELKNALQQQADTGGTGAVADKQLQSLERRLKVTEERLHQERADRANNLSSVEDKLLTENARLQAAEKDLKRQLQREKDKNRNSEHRLKELREENEKLRLSMPFDDSLLYKKGSYDIPYSSHSSQRAETMKISDDMNYIMSQIEKQDGLQPGQEENIIRELWNKRELAYRQLQEWDLHAQELNIDNNIVDGLKNLRDTYSQSESKLKTMEEKVEDATSQRETYETTYKEQLSNLVKERHDALARLKTAEDLLEAVKMENETLRSSLSGFHSFSTSSGYAAGKDGQVEALQVELKGLESKVAQLGRVNKLQEGEVSTLRVQLEARNKALQDCQTELDLAYSRLNGTEADSKQEKIDQLKAQVNGVQAEVKLWTDKCNHVTAEKTRLETEVEKLRKTLEANKSKQQKSELVDSKILQEMRDELVEKESRVTSLTKQLDDAENQLQKTRQDLYIEQEHTQELESEVDTLQQTVAQRAKMFESLSGTERENLAQFQILKETLDGVSQELAQKQAQIVSMEISLSAQKDCVEEMEQKLDDLKQERSEVSQEEVKQTNDRLRVQELEIERTSLKQELTQVYEVVKSLEEQLRQVQTENKQMEQELVKEKTVILQISAEKGEVEQHLEELAEEHDALIQEKNQSEEDLMKLEKKLQEILQKYETEARKQHGNFDQRYPNLPQEARKLVSELDSLRLLAEGKQREVDMLQNKISRQNIEIDFLHRKVDLVHNDSIANREDVARMITELTLKMKEAMATRELNQFLSGEKTRLQTDKNKLEKDLEQEKKNNKQRKTEIDDVMRKVEKSELQHKSAEKETQNRDKVITTLETELHSCKQELAQLQAENSQLKNKVEHLTEDVKSLNAINATLDQRLEMEKNSLMEEKNDLSRTKEELKSTSHQLDLLQHDNLVLSEKLVSEQTTVDRLKSQLQTADEKQTTLQEELRNMTMEMESQKGQLLMTKDTVKKLTDDKGSIYQDYESMCRTVTEKERQLTELKKNSDRQIESLKREYQSEKLYLEQEKSTAIQQRDLTKEECNNLNEQLKQKEIQLSTFGRTLQDLESVTREKKNLEMKLHQLESSSGDSRLLLEGQRKELMALNESLAKQQENVTRLQAANATLQSEVKSQKNTAGQENYELKLTLDQLKTQHENERSFLNDNLAQTQTRLRSVEASLASAVETRDSIQAQKRLQDKMVEELQSKLSDESTGRRLAEQSVGSLRLQVEDMRNEKNVLEARLTEAQHSLSRVEKQLKTERDNGKVLSDKVNKLGNLNENKTTNMKAKEEQVEMLKTEVSKLRQFLETQKQSFAGKLKKTSLELKQQLELSEEEREKLSIQVQQLSSEVEKCQEHIAAKSRENLKLQEDNLTLEATARENAIKLKQTQETLKQETESQSELSFRYREQDEELKRLRNFLAKKVEESGEADKSMWHEMNRVIQELSQQMQNHLDAQRSGTNGSGKEGMMATRYKKQLAEVQGELNTERSLHQITKTSLQALEEDCQRLRHQLHSMRKRDVQSTEKKYKNRMEAINAIIARSQSQAQALLASGGYYDDGINSPRQPMSPRVHGIYQSPRIDTSPDNSLAT